jgi:hypothetical protein
MWLGHRWEWKLEASSVYSSGCACKACYSTVWPNFAPGCTHVHLVCHVFKACAMASMNTFTATTAKHWMLVAAPHRTATWPLLSNHLAV